MDFVVVVPPPFPQHLNPPWPCGKRLDSAQNGQGSLAVLSFARTRIDNEARVGRAAGVMARAGDTLKKRAVSGLRVVRYKVRQWFGS